LTAWDRFSTAANTLADVPGEELARARLLYRCGRLLRYADADRGLRDIRLARKLAGVAGDQMLAADATYSQGLLHCFADVWTPGIAEMTAGIEALEALPVDESHASWSTVNWLADALPAIELVMSSDTDYAAARMAEAGVNHRRGSLPWFLAASGRLHEAIDEADAFLDHVAATDPGPLVLSASGHATFGRGIALAASGDPAGAQAAFRAAREIYDRLDHHAVIGFVLLTELQDVAMRYQTTDLEGRQWLANEAQAALERAGGALPSDVSMRRAHLPLMWLEGRWSDALSLATESDSHGNYVLRRPVSLALAQIHYHQGHTKAANDVIRKLLPDGPAAEPGSMVLADALMLQMLSLGIALEEGELESARRWLESNRRWLDWSGAVAGRVEHALGQASLVMASNDLDGAMDYAGQAVTMSAEPMQPLARLSALRLRGVIAARQGGGHSAEPDFREALALAAACAAPFERARTLVEMAGAGSAREDVLGEAREIAMRLDAAPLIARIDALSGGRVAVRTDSVLTARERDVLALAAQGLTDAEIGEQLFISHRTVSQHLRSVYAKLDVRSRAAATRFAIEHGLV
jgi:DNA-binding CsgD family transcriptional regulator